MVVYIAVRDARGAVRCLGRRHRRIDGKRVLTGWAMLVYLFLYVPIVVVVIFAFNSNRPPASRSGTASRRTGSAGRLRNQDTYLSASRRASGSRFTRSLLATVLGTAAALALARMKPRVAGARSTRSST